MPTRRFEPGQNRVIPQLVFRQLNVNRYLVSLLLAATLGTIEPKGCLCKARGVARSASRCYSSAFALASAHSAVIFEAGLADSSARHFLKKMRNGPSPCSGYPSRWSAEEQRQPLSVRERTQRVHCHSSSNSLQGHVRYANVGLESLCIPGATSF